MYLSIYLSIDQLLVALISRVSSSTFGFSECTVSGRFSDDFGVPKGSQNGAEPDLSRCGTGKLRPHGRPSSGFRPKSPKSAFRTVLDRFWMLFWGVLDAKIVPESTKMASAKRFIFHPFWDLRFHRFSTHFWSKNASKIDVFPARKREAQLCKIIDFPLVFILFWRVGASRIRQKTVAERSRP